MMHNKQLSILIINWNTVDLLYNCLASLTDKLPDNSEIIVVDNGSEDNSVAMVESTFRDVRLIKNKDNLGFAAANNQAMEVATGKYILLLNSDTVVHGDVLSKCCNFMDATPDAAVMGCKVLNADGTLQFSCSNYPDLINLTLLTLGVSRLKWLKKFDRYQMRYWDREDTRKVDVISGCFMVVRQAAIQQVGQLDNQFFFFAEEVDWCKRFLESGWQVYYSPVGTITHLGGGSSKSLSFKRDLMLTNAHIRLHKKHGGLVGGIACWFVLLGFNLSRAIFWNSLKLIAPKPRTKQRASHFSSVIRHFNFAWPK
jgi:hypothetical protein